MNEARLTTIEQIEQFLSASASIEFSAASDDGERYGHISRVLTRFDYPGRKKRERGVLLRYLQHTSGYSRAQVTRLVTRWQRNRLAAVPLAKRYRAPAAPFARKYTALDVTLLVEMDQAHEDACGPAIAHLLQRAYRDYDDPRYERLAKLSVSHLYNLRKSAGYQAQRRSFTKTRPVCNAIGVRKAPGPEGRAGFVRIDTVHQGDQDGVKGVYHITCVDAVSQWQVEACVQGISEAFLLPVLALIIDQFPFVIIGFHSDNGSEYINHQVASLLEKLRIEQTKSRSRQSNDNALAESKNASVVRKHMGYAHIPQAYAKPISSSTKVRRERGGTATRRKEIHSESSKQTLAASDMRESPGSKTIPHWSPRDSYVMSSIFCIFSKNSCGAGMSLASAVDRECLNFIRD